MIPLSSVDLHLMTRRLPGLSTECKGREGPWDVIWGKQLPRAWYPVKSDLVVSAVSSGFLKTSKHGHSIACLGNLVQGLSVLTVNVLPVPGQHLPSFRL